MTKGGELLEEQSTAFPIQTAAKIAWRDLCAAPAKFLFVILAVAVGVAALSGVKGFGYAFRGMLLRNAKQLIAADVQAQTWNDPTPTQLAHLEQIGQSNGAMSHVTETVSMAASPKQRVPQMVAVKGVDPGCYPFYGDLKVSPELPLATLLGDNSSVVATPELLMRFKIAVGDTFRLGGKEFQVKAILVREPDRLASGFGPGMRVLMSREALERTGLIQFGSRAAQRFLFRLNRGADLDRVKKEIKATMPRLFLTDYREGSPAVGRAIDNTSTFLSLISLIALIVGSLGVAMAMHSHLQQRMDTVAIMKAIGARAHQIITIYLLQTLMLGIAGGLIGIAAGALVQKSFPVLIRQVFKLLPEVPWDWSFSLQGMSVGILATLLSTLPPLMGVRNVKPSLVFRRNMSDAELQRRGQWQERVPGLLGAALILMGFAGIAVWLSNSWQIGSYFVAGLLVSISLLGAVATMLLAVLRVLVRTFGGHVPPAVRHGFANLYRPGNQARSVLIALGIGVMFTLCTYLLQRTVLQQVSSEGPGREGNLFLLDIRDTAGVSRLIESQPGVEGKLNLVGYIVSRMLARNGTPVDSLKLAKARKDQLQTVRITTAASLPNGLELKRGEWWNPDTVQPQLAVSEQAQRDYRLELGDQITFQIAGRTVQAPLVAVFDRKERAPVRYDLVFPRKALQGLPVVYYGAARVDPAHIGQVEEALFEQYPTVTVANLADVLKSIQEAIDQVALVIRFLAGFAIFAGVVILSSSVAGTRYRRLREVTIFKTLGATKRRIAAIFSIEFCILGAIAGLIGGILANLFTRLVSDRFLDAGFDFNWSSLPIAMFGTALLANMAGWVASARILDQRPLEVLRHE